MLALYQNITAKNEQKIRNFLLSRVAKGKEHPDRYVEKQGVISRERPAGKLLWLHAASVGEAQSSLVLVQYFIDHDPDVHILITTGTRSSAEFLDGKMPERVIHQFYPLDYRPWCAAFLEHWKPDMVLWIESELWPNMLLEIKARNIPCALVNARMSPKSFFLWSLVRKDAARVLSCFHQIFCQSYKDKQDFEKLGARSCHVADNIKYSAKPLPCDTEQLKILQACTAGRSLWLFASTHEGEEEMAFRVHAQLQPRYPELLSIIIPRHPERRGGIERQAKAHNMNVRFRSADDGARPVQGDQIYIADTLGELGLFYRLASVSVIGRSFSKDGGGGHNPLEAAQLGSAVLYGPRVQNLQAIFDDMNERQAALPLRDEKHLVSVLDELLGNEARRHELQKLAKSYAREKAGGLSDVIDRLRPMAKQAGIAI